MRKFVFIAIFIASSGFTWWGKYTMEELGLSYYQVSTIDHMVWKMIENNNADSAALNQLMSESFTVRVLYKEGTVRSIEFTQRLDSFFRINSYTKELLIIGNRDKEYREIMSWVSYDTEGTPVVYNNYNKGRHEASIKLEEDGYYHYYPTFRPSGVDF